MINSYASKTIQYTICPKCRKELDHDEENDCKCNLCGELDSIIIVKEMEYYNTREKPRFPSGGVKIGNVGGLEIREHKL